MLALELLLLPRCNYFSIQFMVTFLLLQPQLYDMSGFIALIFTPSFFLLSLTPVHNKWKYILLDATSSFFFKVEICRLDLERRQWLKINLTSPSLFHFLDKGLYPRLREGFNSPISHNISDHLSKLHRHTIITASPEAIVNMRIKAIRRVLKKQYVEIFFFTCSQ